VRKNEELRYYIGIMLFFSVLAMIGLIDFKVWPTVASLEAQFREAFFQISSVMTTTGFSTSDYMNWQPFAWIIIVLVMLIGGSEGSTSGGIKVARIVIVLKYCYYEFKRIMHPNAVIPVMYNRSALKNDVVTRVLAFAVLYICLIFIGSLILCFSGMDITESIGAMISCQSCVGPGFGLIGPSGSFLSLPTFSKWFLSFVMLIGRLELFTVLLLFTPVFWRK
jgi:trk system potassium uptake protein TrkH